MTCGLPLTTRGYGQFYSELTTLFSPVALVNEVDVVTSVRSRYQVVNIWTVIANFSEFTVPSQPLPPLLHIIFATI